MNYIYKILSLVSGKKFPSNATNTVIKQHLFSVFVCVCVPAIYLVCIIPDSGWFPVCNFFCYIFGILYSVFCTLYPYILYSLLYPCVFLMTWPRTLMVDVVFYISALFFLFLYHFGIRIIRWWNLMAPVLGY